MATTQRRSILKRFLAAAASLTGLSALTSPSQSGTGELATPNGTAFQNPSLYSGFKKHGNLIFLSGIGAHFDGDAKAHATHVLKELEATLKNAGSSMDKVLKVNVYLHDLNDYKAMNEVYRGLFGNKPPVRTTVATYNGVPNASWVEIDCIAYV